MEQSISSLYHSFYLDYVLFFDVRATFFIYCKFPQLNIPPFFQENIDHNNLNINFFSRSKPKSRSTIRNILFQLHSISQKLSMFFQPSSTFLHLSSLNCWFFLVCWFFFGLLVFFLFGFFFFFVYFDFFCFFGFCFFWVRILT